MTPNAAHEVLDVLKNPGGLSRWEREFNVYFLDVNFDAAEVRLEDDLDRSDEGTVILSIEETVRLLESYLVQRSV